MQISKDWKRFVRKSAKKKKSLPSSLRQRVIDEFMALWNLLMHNEWPTILAAQICAKYPEYDVANVLNPHVIKLATN